MIHRRSRGLAPGCSNGPHWSPLCVRRTHLERGCGSSGIFDCARAPRLVLILLLPYGVCVSRPGLHRDSIIFSSIVWGEGGFAVRNESGPGLHLDSLTSAPDRGGLRCTRGHFLKSLPMLDAGIPDATEVRKAKKCFLLSNRKQMCLLLLFFPLWSGVKLAVGVIRCAGATVR